MCQDVLAIFFEFFVQNASAITYSTEVKENGENADGPGTAYLQDMLQSGKDINSVTPDNISGENITQPGDYAYSVITIGKYMGAETEGKSLNGWAVDAETLLPTNEASVDFVATFRHELGHALGISMSRDVLDWDGNIIDTDKVKDEDIQTTSDGKYIMRISKTETAANSWVAHLKDENGNQAKAGMYIVTPNGFNDLKERNPELTESDCFIVSATPTADGKGYAYFYGDNVTEALNGAMFFGRSALPVNG